ncbi:hypothetical protein [Candidatus Lokiarchaeum ossiferum]|uniref:hypothetical protein n=1 Tax=Candidatus Lokiarchaeum ossiferum TaxID=2951803 RepID=UPI00352CBF7E
MSTETHEESNEYTIIIDIGQGSTKVGFAGEETPRSIFPTVTGKPKYQQMAGGQTQDIYVGNDTIRMRGVLKLDYPIKRGNVMDWDQYFAILNHIFYNVLRIPPARCNVIYLIPPLTLPDIAQYFARVLFETHKCKSVAMLDSATTAVFSIGETTGLSIELGCGLTHVTPVMNGQIYAPSIKRLNLAGIDVEEQLASALTQYGIFIKKEIVREIKEKVLKISLNPTSDSVDPANNVIFTLPDGEPLTINSQSVIMSGEILFNPGLIGLNSPALPQAVIDSLRAVDPFYWRPLLKKIIFSGGSSYLQGLVPRLVDEIQKILPQLGPFPPEEDEPKTEDAEEKVEKPSEILNQKTEDNCPKCGEIVILNESSFCPYCGFSLEVNQIEILDESHHKLSRKEKKLIKKTSIDDDELANIASEVEGEYGSEDEINDLITLLEKKTNTTMNDIKIITPKDRFYASFKGAAILGALPSFKKFMVTYEQFTKNPDSVIVKFHDIIPSM